MKRIGACSIVVLTLMVGSCTTPPSVRANDSIKEAARALIGDDGLVRAPESEVVARPDVYLTAVAQDFLGLPPPTRVREEDVARTQDLPDPWGTWAAARAMNGSPGAPVKLPADSSLPPAPTPTGDHDSDSVMLWAWLDAEQRVSDAPPSDRASAQRLVAAIGPTHTWYGSWRRALARGLTGLPPLPVPDLPPPAAGGEDLAFETLGYVSLVPSPTVTSRTAHSALQADLTWPVCSVESMAAARAVQLLGDQRTAAARLALCSEGALDGVIRNTPVHLGSVSTTFAVAELLNEDFRGLLAESTLDSLAESLRTAAHNETNATERLTTIALLHMAGRSVDEFRPEAEAAATRLRGRHTISRAAELAERVPPLRRVLGVIDLPELELQTERSLDPDHALFLLQTSDRFANGKEISHALPDAQATAKVAAETPSPTLRYYRAVAALPAAERIQLSQQEQDRIATGLTTLRGCDLSPYLYRVTTRENEPARCSFQMSVLARMSSFEVAPR